MVKFNTKTLEQDSLTEHKDVTKNYEGSISFKLDHKTELYQRVASCLFGEPRFYESGQDQAEAIIELVRILCTQGGLNEYVLNMAEYARNVLHLRTVPIVLLVEASRYEGKHEPKLVAKTTPKIVQRADELAECIAYWTSRYGHIGDMKKKGSLPNSLKKGLAQAIKKFDEYQLAKYDRNNAKVKLIDVMRICHPKPTTEEQKLLFKKVKDDTLATPETWETHISKYGSHKETWEYIIDKMPIMAMLRNLRNFIDNNVSEEIIDSRVIFKLTNEKIIRNSKQFPFRFLAAYREIQKRMSEWHSTEQSKSAYKILQALEIAIDISVANLPELSGKTALFADNSGSMDSHLSGKTTLKHYDIANTMLCIADRMTNHNAILGSFATDLVILQQTGDKKENTILQNASAIHDIDVGGSTDTWKCLAYLIQNKIHVDRILVFTDEESYDSGYRSYGGYENSVASLLRKYKHEVNPLVYFYNINLNGYGTTQTPQDEPNTCLIGGWSERILSYISEFEKDSKQMIERINNHEY